MEEKIIQVFCDTCSRGVLVWKESMYKCQKCGRQVCAGCFDKAARQCAECARPLREATRVQQSGVEQVIEQRRIEWERRRRFYEVLGAIVSVVLFVGGAIVFAYLLLTGRCQSMIPRF